MAVTKGLVSVHYTHNLFAISNKPLFIIPY